jgi:hypothetical protein
MREKEIEKQKERERERKKETKGGIQFMGLSHFISNSASESS